MLSGLPYLFTWITMTAGGQIADVLRKRRLLSTTWVRKLFNTIGLYACTIKLFLSRGSTVCVIYLANIATAVVVNGLLFYPNSLVHVISVYLPVAITTCLFVYWEGLHICVLQYIYIYIYIYVYVCV